MEVLLNDLSLQGQFVSICAFQTAIESVMRIRNRMQQFGRELYCHRNVAQAHVTHDLTMQQAVQQLNQNERRAVMSWLSQHGPFWEDVRSHNSDDYFECQDQVVTDTALGESAYHCFNGSSYHTLSISPSHWLITPIRVVWHRDNETIDINVTNHWDISTLEASLKAATPPIHSWEQLASEMPARCTNLTFAIDSFKPLLGSPFVPSAAQRIVELLETLNTFKGCFDEQGQRTAEGQRIYQDHFTGKKAWFTDSSDSEKIEFKSELTFKHPDNSAKTLFCAGHGKVKTPQIRIHFPWSICADEPLYVVYIGLKITKK